MSGLASDDLVEDYKISLEDLTTNDRFQINNLTVIARENTEHAMAISRVLENHIGKVGLFPTTQCLAQGKFLTAIVDASHAETAGPICSRFHRQERRNPLHSIPGTEHVSNFYECVYAGRYTDSSQTR